MGSMINKDNEFDFCLNALRTARDNGRILDFHAIRELAKYFEQNDVEFVVDRIISWMNPHSILEGEEAGEVAMCIITAQSFYYSPFLTDAMKQKAFMAMTSAHIENQRLVFQEYERLVEREPRGWPFEHVTNDS